jgi:hypothetical protein
MTTKKLQHTSRAKNRSHPLDNIVSAEIPPTLGDDQGIARSAPLRSGISDSVRRIVVQRPPLTLSEISLALVEFGWNRIEIAKRQSTIATLRSDAVSILTLARQHGWVMNGKAGELQ